MESGPEYENYPYPPCYVFTRPGAKAATAKGTSGAPGFQKRQELRGAEDFSGNTKNGFVEDVPQVPDGSKPVQSGFRYEL